MSSGSFAPPEVLLVRAAGSCSGRALCFYSPKGALVMALLISVAPAEQGWAVRPEALAADLPFERGGRAEAAARDLANRLAASGHAAEVRVFLRDGAEAGRFLHPARAWAS